MAVLAFPPWTPDRAKTARDATDYVRNVVPKAEGWGPLPSASATSEALPSTCRGAFTARNSDGTFEVFAGTATGLYQLNGVSWNAITRSVGGNYNLASGHSWSKLQFGIYVLFVNINDDPQFFDLNGSSHFAALGGSPPRARYVGSESGYVDLFYLLNDERKFRRSGLNNAEFWTIGERGADFQELPDGGFIRGTAGDETGSFIFSEAKIRRLVNQPGSEIGFTLQDVETARGCIAPESIVQVGSRTFFLAEDGFYELGIPSSPIGATRVNEFFMENMDLDDIDQVQGSADPTRPIVWWRYKSSDSSSLDYTDRLIGYNWQLDRWCYAEVDLEWLFPLSVPGLNLEQIGSLYATLEDVPFSFDSRYWNGGRPALAGFDPDHKLVVFEGSSMEALLRTNDMPFAEGRRVFVRGWRPIGDAEDCTGRVGTKEKFSDAPSWGAANSQNVTGEIPARASGRVGRLELTIPSGTTWQHMVGAEVDYRIMGKR